MTNTVILLVFSLVLAISLAFVLDKESSSDISEAKSQETATPTNTLTSTNTPTQTNTVTPSPEPTITPTSTLTQTPTPAPIEILAALASPTEIPCQISTDFTPEYLNGEWLVIPKLCIAVQPVKRGVMIIKWMLRQVLGKLFLMIYRLSLMKSLEAT